MSLINREALYEKACDLEAQALSYVGKIVNDETRTDEWRIWSAILAERTVFKHDIFDAPEVKPEPKWIPVTDRLPEEAEARYWVCTDGGYQCQCRWTNDVFGLGEGDTWTWKIFDIPQYSKVIAWMPLPQPYKVESEEV